MTRFMRWVVAMAALGVGTFVTAAPPSEGVQALSLYVLGMGFGSWLTFDFVITHNGG